MCIAAFIIALEFAVFLVLGLVTASDAYEVSFRHVPWPLSPVFICYNCMSGLFLFSPSRSMHAWHIA